MDFPYAQDQQQKQFYSIQHFTFTFLNDKFSPSNALNKISNQLTSNHLALHKNSIATSYNPSSNHAYFSHN